MSNLPTISKSTTNRLGDGDVKTAAASGGLNAGGNSSVSLIPSTNGGGSSVGLGGAAPAALTSAPVPVVNSKKSAPSKIVHKLSSLGNRFTGFEEQLSLQNKKKKEDDDKRIVALQAQIDALQATLVLEQRNRATSVKALQKWLEDKIAKWTERIEAPFLAKLEVLDKKVETVAARIEVIHKSHIADIESFPRRIDVRAAELLQQIKDFRLIEQQNQAIREERENKIAAKIGESRITLQQRMDADKKVAEARVAELRIELLAETKSRTIGYDLVKSKLDDELVTIKASIAKEIVEREKGDEELVQAINHYTAALQDGIKIVSENK